MNVRNMIRSLVRIPVSVCKDLSGNLKSRLDRLSPLMRLIVVIVMGVILLAAEIWILCVGCAATPKIERIEPVIPIEHVTGTK